MAGSDVSTISTIFSAIGGSIVGGTISTIVAFVVQKRGLAAAKAQRDADRFDNQKARAFSLFLKMVRIHSSLAIMDAFLARSIQEGKAKGFTALWQMILPLGNLPERVRFSTDEVALLLSLDIDLFNDLGPYDEVHNSMIDLFQIYANRRNAVLEKFGAKMDGATSTGTTSLTKEEAEWLAPRAYELDDLASGMVKAAEHDRAESQALLKRIHKLFVKEFGLNSKLEFKSPS